MHTSIKLASALVLGTSLYIKMPSEEVLKKRLEKKGYAQLLVVTEMHKKLGHQYLKVETLEQIVESAQIFFKDSWNLNEKEQDKDTLMHILLQDAPHATLYWQAKQSH